MALPRQCCRRFLLILWICFVLFSNSHSRSLNGDILSRHSTAVKPTIAPHPIRNSSNFVDGHCPPFPRSTLTDINNNCQKLCTSDLDCHEDNKCCQNGCSFLCMEPWFPEKVVDWSKSSSPNQIPGNVMSKEETTKGEPCSTSILGGMEPLKCPTHYVCLITSDGDIDLNIPNRGECVRASNQEVSKPVQETGNNGDPNHYTDCFYKGKQYKSEEKFPKDCIVCVCYEGVVFCENKLCPVEIGIPGTVPDSKEEHINIDSENIEGSGPEDLEESGSTQGNTDDEKLDLPQENIDEEDADTQGKFEISNSTFTKKIIHSIPFYLRLNNTKEINSSSTRKNFGENISSETEMTLESNGTGLKKTFRGRRNGSDSEVENMRGYRSEALQYITGSVGSVVRRTALNLSGKLIDRRYSFSTDVIRLTGKDSEPDNSGDGSSEYESGSTQRDIEETDIGSGNESSGEAIKEEMGFQKTIVLQKWKPTEKSAESGFGFMQDTLESEEEDSGSAQNEKDSESGSNEGNVQSDSGSTPKRLLYKMILKKGKYKGQTKSLEYLETTDDEN